MGSQLLFATQQESVGEAFMELLDAGSCQAKSKLSLSNPSIDPSISLQIVDGIDTSCCT
jgi:hypothetical protein